jgi:hypothetical protein
MIRLAKCERAIRRLYHAGESLPHHERHPFRDPMEVVRSGVTLGQYDLRLPTSRKAAAGQSTEKEESALTQRILWSASHFTYFSVRLSGPYPSHLTSISQR